MPQLIEILLGFVLMTLFAGGVYSFWGGLLDFSKDCKNLAGFIRIVLSMFLFSIVAISYYSVTRNN